ncbi:MAG: COX15/CtaA family protein [Actinomycetota bacterium]|nr:COX15/CtaA family protein [Actinomycetota bacterium]
MQQVETTRLGRLRALALSPRAFRRLAALGALMLFAIVATGATVRLTASGLGCEHWPGCQPGNPFPASGFHSYIEFGNRMVAGLTILVTLLIAVAGFLTPRLPRRTAWLGVAVFLGTLAQAPLGAITVYLDLHPLIVMPHLLLSILLLGGAVLILLDGLRLERGDREPALPEEVRRFVPLLPAACFGLLVSGAFATAAGPHSGGEEVTRFGTLDVALVFHAAAVALFGLGLIFLLGYLAARRDRSPLALRGAAGVALLTVIQMGLGELQYRTHLPWGLVLAHVAVSAAVWAGTVALASLVRRPLARA